MSKHFKILIGIFCIGVLICGLGIGIAFMEFSTLTYGGKQIVGKTKMVTENVDVPFEPGEEQYLVWGQWGWKQTKIVTDSKVPEDLQCGARYTPCLSEPGCEGVSFYMQMDRRRLG